MGAAIDGKKVAGFAISGKIVAGIAQNGVVIWRKPSTSYPELIVNGGFEDGLTGWTVIYSGQIISDSTSDGVITAAYEGSRWFKSTADNGGVAQTVSVEPGASYHIQYAYGAAVGGRKCWCYIKSGTKVLTQKWTTATIEGWHWVEFDYTIPANTTSVTLQLGETRWGRFDAVSMRRNK